MPKPAGSTSFDCGCDHVPCPCEELDCPYLGASCNLCPMHAAAPQMLAFLRALAGMLKDGEDIDDGEVFDLTNDDAVESLHLAIDGARQLVTPLEDVTL